LARDAAVVRAFFAVEIGAAARAVAHAVAERLAREPGGDAVRWVRPEAYHVTLRFLGPTPRTRAPELAAAARRATHSIAPFRLQLGALAGLPPRRPNVVVVGVEAEPPAAAGSLAALAAALEEVAVGAGYAPEGRAFQPHLTLGRVRERRRRAPLLGPGLEPAEPAPFAVDSFVLFESALAPGGSRYTALERIPLEMPSPP
jgi:2'-5' RNA ligase